MPRWRYQSYINIKLLRASFYTNIYIMNIFNFAACHHRETWEKRSIPKVKILSLSDSLPTLYKPLPVTQSSACGYSWGSRAGGWCRETGIYHQSATLSGVLYLTVHTARCSVLYAALESSTLCYPQKQYLCCPKK